MSISLPPQWLTQLFDNNGELLAGGKIYTYAAGTTTPLATYSDEDGAENTNPIILDAAGRASVFVALDTAYKFIVTDANDNILLTVDDIVSVSDGASTSTQYEVALSYVGTPGVQAVMAAHQLIRSIAFPVDFTGSDASVGTTPGADYAVSIQNNGVEIGTCTFDTSGIPTFATTGGATQPAVFGDRITFVAPDSGSAADLAITLLGAL